MTKKNDDRADVLILWYGVFLVAAAVGAFFFARDWFELPAGNFSLSSKLDRDPIRDAMVGLTCGGCILAIPAWFVAAAPTMMRRFRG